MQQFGTVDGYMEHVRRGEEPCELCRQAVRDVLVGWKISEHERKLQPCGTYAAFQRHQKAGEEPCDSCKMAAREYNKNRSERRRRANGALPLLPRVLVTPTTTKYCGTRYGHKRHYARGEFPCDACREANREALRAWRMR